MKRLTVKSIDKKKSEVILVDSEKNEYSFVYNASFKDDLLREAADTNAKSNLTMKEIQDKIRAGYTLEKLVGITNHTVSTIERLATPVIGEKKFIINEFKRYPIVKLISDYTSYNSNQTISSAISSGLDKKGIYDTDVTWGATKQEKEPWKITIKKSGDNKVNIEFLWDNKAKIIRDMNKAAKDVLGLLEDKKNILNTTSFTAKKATPLLDTKSNMTGTFFSADRKVDEVKEHVTQEEDLSKGHHDKEENNSKQEVEVTDAIPVEKTDTISNEETKSEKENIKRQNVEEPPEVKKVDGEKVDSKQRNHSKDNKKQKLDTQEEDKTVKVKTRTHKKDRTPFPSWNDILFGDETKD